MARYLPDYDLFFEHIPRTGGMWVEKAIEASGLNFVRWVKKQPAWICRRHALLAHYWPSAYEKIKYKFSFVRHPLPYYKSVWKFVADQTPGRLAKLRGLHKSRTWLWHPHRTAALEYQEGMSFEEWANRMMDIYPLWYTRIVDLYLGPKDGEFIDFIGRTESLVEDFFLAMEIFRVPLSNQAQDAIHALGRVNAGKTSAPADDSETINRILSMEREVIDRFYGEKLEQRYYNQLLNSATYNSKEKDLG